MFAGNRLVYLATALVALVLAYGCQIRDGGVPTEADRPLESADHTDMHTLKQEIEALIGQISRPNLGKSILKSFASIDSDLKKGKVANAQAKALTLIAFILDHYQKGDLIQQVDLSTKVGTLNLKLSQYVGLVPAGTNVAGAACLPGDLVCEALPPGGEAEIPGDLITEPFNLYAIEVDCSTLGDGINWIPPCFEVITQPEQDFGTSPSSSLSLSDFDTAVVGVCADIDDGLTPGIDVFLWHEHDGTVEPTPFVPGLDACSDLSSAWASPLLATFQPVLEMLGPKPLYAAAVGNFSINGSISNFSTLFACEPGCLATTTTVSIVQGTTSFTEGDEITLRAVVSPAPSEDENPRVVFNIGTTTPPAPTQPVVDGVAEHTFVCGSPYVPVSGSAHTAGAAFLGTAGYELSASGQVLSFTCSSGE